MTDVWERRLRRAEELESLWPHSAEILTFFRAITSFQAEISREKEPTLLDRIPRLLELIARHGPEPLSREIDRLHELSEDQWRSAYLGALRERIPGTTVEALCLRCLIEPGMVMGAADAVPLTPIDPAACRKCPGAPGVVLLREDREAETLRRSLVCWRCWSEWDFPRVVCPSCGEEKSEKLPRFTAQEIPWIRVEACDSCGKYLKAVDLSKEPGAEPVVDELASTPLDLLARERGYEKIAPNLAGL